MPCVLNRRARRRRYNIAARRSTNPFRTPTAARRYPPALPEARRAINLTELLTR